MKRLLTLSALAAFVLPSSADILFNTDVENGTGSIANDYHVRLTADGPINIGTTFETPAHGSPGGPVFNDALSNGGVTGNGTGDVTINWDGAQVNQGEMTHIGAWAPETPPGLVVRESWWTFGGLPLVPKDLVSGRLPSSCYSGKTEEWLINRTEFFTGLAGGPAGTIWWESQGTQAVTANFHRDGPIYARTALRISDVLLPIEDLNGDLDGFGPAGPITLLPPCGGFTGFNENARYKLSAFGEAKPGGLAEFVVEGGQDGDLIFLIFGFSHTNWNGLQLPIALEELGLGDGELAVANQGSFLMGVATGGEAVSLGLRLPDAWLDCELPIYLQGIVFSADGQLHATTAVGMNIG